MPAISVLIGILLSINLPGDYTLWQSRALTDVHYSHGLSNQIKQNSFRMAYLEAWFYHNTQSNLCTHHLPSNTMPDLPHHIRGGIY